MSQLKSKFFIATLGLLLLAVDSSAKGWRGITPLHSKRADIARLFNQCAYPKLGCNFSIGNEQIYVVFSDNTNADSDECGTKLPPDTVLLIEVKLKRSQKVNRESFTNKSFRMFDPASPPGAGFRAGYKGYINEKEGLIVKTYKGRILQLDYIAAAKDRHLCPSYYEAPESFIQFGLFMHCFSIILNCPTNKPKAGDEITFSADFPVYLKTTLTWTVSAGKIIAGQGTRVITVDTSGLQGQTIYATVTQSDMPCPQSVYCAVQILPK